MTAYVLAAGYGTRMYPVTRDLPKALLDIGGTTVLDHLARGLRGLGVSDIVLVTNHRFHGAFEAWKRAQGPSGGITLVNDGTRTPEERLGALGDLRLALRRVPPRADPVVVVASDQVIDADLRQPLGAFRRRGHTTLVVRRVDHPADAAAYNEVRIGDGGRVTGMREKPRDARSGWCAVALYFFRSRDLALLDDFLDGADDRGRADAPGHFLSWLVERVPCYVWPLDGRWFDAGSPDGLAAARRWARTSGPG